MSGSGAGVHAGTSGAGQVEMQTRGTPSGKANNNNDTTSPIESHSAPSSPPQAVRDGVSSSSSSRRPGKSPASSPTHVDALMPDAWAMDAPGGLLAGVAEGEEDGEETEGGGGGVRRSVSSGRGQAGMSASAAADGGDPNKAAFSNIFTKEGFDQFADSVKCELCALHSAAPMLWQLAYSFLAIRVLELCFIGTPQAAM